jgi:AcrR family transcriptional regulator
MARRSDHTREELRQLILDAGAAQIAVLGAEQFSARQVADDIGYTVRTLYNVFGSHQNLLLELHRCTLEECHSALAEIMAHTRRNRLHAWAEGLIEFADTNRLRWLAVSAVTLQPDALVPPGLRAAWASLHDQLVGELEPVVGTHKALRERTALTFWAGLTGIIQFSLNGSYTPFRMDDPKRIARELIDTYLRGLKYAPPGFGRSR